MIELDLRFMYMALTEATKGKGRTSPNPCVGAVIVRDGQLLGCGYHRKAGEAHAEVNAIAAAGAAACVGATLYVTLEPCNHTGRTPPCSQAVLAAGIRRVVIGMSDPNPVAAGGAAYLRAHGVAVEIGILEHECRQLNSPFIKHSTTGLPWVALKAGMSLDGRISRVRGYGGPITGAESQRRVHGLRNEFDAILIGIGTALIDNPLLTTRMIEHGRDPLRIVLDSELRLPPAATMLHQRSSAQTWIFCRHDASPARRNALEQQGAVVHQVDECNGRLDLHQVLRCVGQAGITSVLVEGGATVHGAFLRAKAVDEVYLFIAPHWIGEAGTPLIAGDAPDLPLMTLAAEKIGEDILLHGLTHPFGEKS